MISFVFNYFYTVYMFNDRCYPDQATYLRYKNIGEAQNRY
jgi:hypothetical protein